MAIKGVIFDVSDTLLEGKTGPAVPEIPKVLDRLHELGVLIIAVENNGPTAFVENLLRNRGIYFDYVVTSGDVGKNKGSPLWRDYICSITGLRSNQLIYVGDSDGDMRTASHSHLIYFHAGWRTPRKDQYGLDAPKPGYIGAVVEHIFLKEHNWWWDWTALDADNRRVKQLALIDGDGAGSTLVKNRIIDVFKEGNSTIKIGLMPLKEFVLLHILAGLYAYADDILDTNRIWWTSIPSSTPGKASPMIGFLDTSAKLFRFKYKDDLIIRTRQIPHTRNTRNNLGIREAFEAQLTSLQLNPTYEEKLFGREILLFDDFITAGVSSEAIRNILMAAGASKVTTVAIGKYNKHIEVLTRPPNENLWNPFKVEPRITETLNIRTNYSSGTNQFAALGTFLNSYQAMSQETW